MAQKNTPVTKAKVDIEFENELWNARKLDPIASSRLRIFNDEDIAKEAYLTPVAKPGRQLYRYNITGIGAINFVLSLGRYVGSLD